MASFNDTYQSDGTEGASLVRSALIGKAVLLCFMGNNPLKRVTSSPGVSEYTFNSATGTLGFGIDLSGQVIQSIYKDI